MKTYKEEIEEMAIAEENEDFFNTDAEHAKVVLLYLMKYAKDHVYIVCSNMCSDVSNNKGYIEAVKEFIEDDQHKIKILYTDYKEENTEIKNILKDKENVKIKKLKDLSLVRLNDGKLYNFTVADGKSYRFETDVENKIAFGNFNDKDFAEALEEKFNQIFNNDEKTEII